jgi:hypothetical protein
MSVSGSAPPTQPNHKRSHSNTAELPPPKVPKFVLKTKAYLDPSHIYVVTTEQTGPYLDTETKTIGAYATYEDAERKALALQRISDEEKFETFRDDGCTVVSAEDDESDRYEIRIEPMELRPPGSEETPDDEEGEEGEEEEDEDKGEDESDEGSFEAEDPYAAIKAAQQKFGGVLKLCKGAGCGEPLCFSCWPQREKDWENFRPVS